MNGPMRAEQASIGARGIDTILTLDAVKCAALKNTNIDFVVRYLSSLSAAEVQTILSSGLALFVCTYADVWDGNGAAAHAKNLNLPTGCTIWLDVESCGDLTADDVIARVNTWAYAVRGAGYDPGLYVGCDCKLSSAQLTTLSVDRYWRSCSYVPEPSVGFSMMQLSPGNTTWAGILVDVDVCQHDYRGRAATWIKG